MQGTLTDRQERFVHEYLIDQNAAAALRRCGYSTKTGGAQAHALMKNPLVRERIRAGLAALFAELDVTALRLLRERVRIAFFDPRKLFDDDNRPIPVAKLDEDSAGAIVVSYRGKTANESIHVRTGNRNAALSALERRYAQFLTLQAQAFGELPEDFELPRERMAREQMTRESKAAGDQAARAAAQNPVIAAEHFKAENATTVSAPVQAGMPPRNVAVPAHAVLRPPATSGNPPRGLAASAHAAPKPPAPSAAQPARVCVPSRKYGVPAPGQPVRNDAPYPASLPTPIAGALARAFSKPAPRHADVAMA